MLSGPSALMVPSALWNRLGHAMPVLAGEGKSMSNRVSQSDPKDIWGAPDIFSFPTVRPKGPFRPARPNTLSGAPSPSPVHMGRSGHVGHNEKRGEEWRARCSSDTEV
jgi:hypothetical protein